MKTKNGDKAGPGRRAVLAAGVLGAAALVPRPARAAARPVRVLSTTDQPVIQPLIDDFERRHPSLRVDYLQLGSVEIVQHLLAAGGPAPDVLWSSAMDLQIKLVNDGHAARHDSPHEPQLPRWAVWKREAYATTYEPVGLLFHRGLWPGAELPRTHAALAAALAADPERWRARVATYDIERAGLGYLLAAHDDKVSPQAWHLLERLAACRATLHAQTQAMLDSVGSGQALVAYNVLGPYAEAFALGRPELAVVYPADYTLIASRVAFIARRAPNPEGARLWLDHLLSPQGQRILGDECGLYPVRADTSSKRNGAALQRQLGHAARPIALGPGLLAHLDSSRREAFIERWRKAFAPAP